jgi:hypothetical protein
MGIGHAIYSHALCMKLGWQAAIAAESMVVYRRQDSENRTAAKLNRRAARCCAAAAGVASAKRATMSLSRADWTK